MTLGGGGGLYTHNQEENANEDDMEWEGHIRKTVLEKEEEENENGLEKNKNLKG